MHIFKKYCDRRIYSYSEKRLVNLRVIAKKKKVKVLDADGKNITSKIRSAAKVYGTQPRHRLGSNKNVDLEKRIKKHLKAGKTFHQIAQEEKRSYSTIQSYCYRKGLKPIRRSSWKRS